MDDLIRILFLSANPSDTSKLGLDEEVRAIDQALHRAEFRDKFDLIQQWAVRVSELQHYFLRYKPHIIHFSGHGSHSNEIIFLDDVGKSQPVSSRALGKLFSVLKGDIQCVVLNACYSQPQALAIAENIECVIGMSSAISDSAAISFAANFYQALGYGQNIKTAFDSGCVQIDLENLDEQETPKLITLRTNPEEIMFISNKAQQSPKKEQEIRMQNSDEYATIKWLKDSFGSYVGWTITTISKQKISGSDFSFIVKFSDCPIKDMGFCVKVVRIQGKSHLISTLSRYLRMTKGQLLELYGDYPENPYGEFLLMLVAQDRQNAYDILEYYGKLLEENVNYFVTIGYLEGHDFVEISFSGAFG